ncbi:MAG: sialidase family protein [Ktedonobacterales bacterium]
MRNRRTTLLLAVTSVTVLLAGSIAFGRGGAAHGAPGYTNVVESSPLGTQYAYDFNNNCVSGYYGNPGTALQGNHSESDLAVNPTNGSLLGASKFFFGSTADAGWSDFSPQYMFHVGSYSMSSTGTKSSNTIIPGYSDGVGCQGSGQSTGIHWSDSTDPNVAFASTGDAFTAVLPFTLYTNVMPNGAIFVNKWAAGAHGWGVPVLASPLYQTTGFGQGPDKQWVAAYTDKSSGTEYVNACWTVFHGAWGSQVYCSQSTNGGQTFWNASSPVQISVANQDGPFNTYVYPRYDANGTLYVTYVADNGAPATDAINVSGYQRGDVGVVYTVISHDHGATFSAPIRGPSTNILPYILPNTSFRDGIAYYMYVSQVPLQSGQTYAPMYVAAEDENNTLGTAHVNVYESRDGGQTWSSPLQVNDNLTSSDHWQPTVTADSAGHVAVAFYDRRNACPSDTADAGKTNFCIDTYVQFYQDNGSTLTASGGNLRASNYTWDPQAPANPAQPNCGDDLPRPDGSCSVSFIGDYFGAALGNGNLYVLSVSTHNFGGNPNNDQQQVLQIVPIP